VYDFVGIREAYYEWTWGDAQFIVLDPYWNTLVKPDSLNGWRWSLRDDQYNWLTTVLENSTSKFKFVFSHHQLGGNQEARGGVEVAHLNEWGGHSHDGTYEFEKYRPGWAMPIHDLLVKHDVTTFFHGHDHLYVQQEKDGIVYQLVPQPSLPNYGKSTGWNYVEGVMVANTGHIRVTVSPNGVTSDYVRAYTPDAEKNGTQNGDIAASYFVSETVTGAEIIEHNNIVSSSIECTPNPFQGETTINISLNKNASNLVVAVFNVTGEKVADIVYKKQVQSGTFTVKWNGTDHQNNPLPNGLYMVRCISDQNEITSSKLMLKR
jgi:hypothetical protein